jgi:hypothetical protein
VTNEKERPDLAATEAYMERLLKEAEDAHEWAVWQLDTIRRILEGVRADRAAEAAAATTTTPPPKEDA